MPHEPATNHDRAYASSHDIANDIFTADMSSGMSLWLPAMPYAVVAAMIDLAQGSSSYTVPVSLVLPTRHSGSDGRRTA
jgi:hypothetical protein